MLSTLSLLFFISFLSFLFLNLSSLLLSLVLLELITFLILFSLTSSFYIIPSSFFLISIFCIFVLESVLGLVGLLNMIHFSGSDFVSIPFTS